MRTTKLSVLTGSSVAAVVVVLVALAAGQASATSSTGSSQMHRIVDHHVVVRPVARPVVRAPRPATPARAVPKKAPVAKVPIMSASGQPGPLPGSPPIVGRSQVGKATWYKQYAGGCAHRVVPKGTVVHITNTANGRTATCRVNDSGPNTPKQPDRIIDLDKGVFEQLAPSSKGVIDVRITWDGDGKNPTKEKPKHA